MIRSLLVCLVMSASFSVEAQSIPVSTVLEKGKALAEDSTRGNCLSCHYVQGGEMTGSIAPPLIQMKARFPDKAILRLQIWDATIKNPESVMPPYGRHSILTEEELDWVLEYVYSL